MEEALTIKQAAKLLNLSYNTVYARKRDWGFFQMAGVRGWRVYKSDLDRQRQKENNSSRLCVQVGEQEKRKCRSEKTKTVSGKLISRHRQGSAFDALVKRLKKS
ncbi:helix-turn-helix domain-containing protein [Testudinibacter sp. TR-2022]|uniref:helix-turn-helix domain-containing protein n=1 Tax=Testudinibacter sp. TR-2022 TaxID=2585029 RepID=UPI00111B5899|nr:helix-turn-helix domain-containing protein [Testudinibacter sp. TR-2022]TNH06507.1 helix-turn-helix domain-containing protein [Pasteurellaceae bacterium Phil11]TNH25500.1 helix-turn-helix domain-containing protein [Testudinibacter sp. TR-2022]TNH28081.1 helix-turn-helix domain-containing protein [Testudinibacter sp. TR-2022]